MANEINEITELMKMVSLTTFNAGSKTWVYVTHIETPENFYVRPMKYSRALRQMEACDDPKNVSASNLFFGSIILFKSKQLGHLVRGEVREIHEAQKEYTLLAIDYGFVEKNVPLKQIYAPKTDLSPLSLITQCQLADCKPIGSNIWSQRSIDAMKFYVSTDLDRAVMLVRSTDGFKLTVELQNSLDDIATVMALTEYSTLGYDCNKVNRMSTPAEEKQFINFKKYAPNDTVRVRVLSGSTLEKFYVAEVNDYKEYEREKADFKNDMRRSKQISVDEFKKNTPVGVCLMRKGFERGIIKEIVAPDVEATVQLLDLGTIEYVRISDMFRMNEYYCSKPAKAIYCTADEDQRWNNNLPKFLYPGYEFMITVIEPGHQFEKPNTVKLTRIKGF